MKRLSSEIKGGCTGCRYFVQIAGRRYGMCTRGGEVVRDWRGSWPVARNWPWPWHCGNFALSDEDYLQYVLRIEAEDGVPPACETELEMVHGTSNLADIFG